MLLIAVFGSRHWARTGAVVVAPLLFASMPVVWLAARGLAPQVVLVPFVAAWLLACDQFFRTRQHLWLGLGGAILGAMMHIHLAGLVMAPAYFSVAVVALLMRRDRVTACGAFAAGFAVVALPWLVRTAFDDTALTQAINAYGLYDANRYTPLQGVREIGSWVGLTVRSEVYWDCLNPALLFLGKGAPLAALTGSQVLLLPMAVPLVRGLAAYLTRPRDEMDYLVIGAFFVFPLATALLARPPLVPRLILLAPVAAIIATRGCYPGAFSTSAAASPAMPATVATVR